MKSAAKILIINFLFSYLLLNTAYGEEVLTWQDCLAEAEKNNPDLISAVQEINIQKAAKAITVSGIFPQTSANVDASTAKTTAISSSDIATSATNDSYSYGLSATQLIFDGFKTFNDIGAASEKVKAAQHAYRFASSEVRLKLRTAFVDLLKTQELIKVIEEIVKIRNDSLALINQQYQAGLEHKGALMIAEANLAEANFELSQAKRNLETAQRQLSQAMGRQEFRPISVKGEFIVSESAKEKPNFEELVKNNPQVSQAIAKENSSLYGIKSAYGNFAPKISGSASKEKKRWALGS